MKVLEVIHLIVVGAFWGCTNPFLRSASKAVNSTTAEADSKDKETDQDGVLAVLIASVKKLQYWRLWLPYLLNQCGSILYYLLLSESDLTLAVPISNALALVFSIVTSFFWLGETVNKPFQAIVGAFLVMLGVAICLHSRAEDDEQQQSLESVGQGTSKLASNEL